MHYVHFQVNGNSHYGIVEDGEIVQIEGDLFSDHTRTRIRHKLSSVKILPPVRPSKVIGTFVNDRRFYPPSVEPWAYTHWYVKTPDSIIATDEDIRVPHLLEVVETELELVAIIGKTCKNVPVADALRYVFGFTIGNDITVSYDKFLQKPPLGPLRLIGVEGLEFAEWLKTIDAVLSTSLKSMDSSAPIGPCIATDFDTSDVKMRVIINDKVVAEGSSATMLDRPAKIISDISQFITLRPGDIIFTGTQTRWVPTKIGDLVALEVEGIGTLRNRVVKDVCFAPPPDASSAKDKN